MSEVPQYGHQELFKSAEAQLLPVDIGSDGFDSFGNRFFVSPELSYLDREHVARKAGILLSHEGQTFVEEHPGILKAIDRGLSQIEAVGASLHEIDLGKDGWISEYAKGLQSNVYLLEVGHERYILKTQNKETLARAKDPMEPFLADMEMRDPIKDRSQPYINEMLQVQHMAHDLSAELKAAHVRMPTFLFASGQVSCTRFEEGTPADADKIQANKKFVRSLFQYSERQRETNPLWKNISIDRRISDNFIDTGDGSFVFIDPFVHS